MTFDGANFIVTWTDGRSGACTDIYGARVTPGGTVIDNFPVVTGDGSQWSADLCAAPGGQVLLAFGGWTGSVAGRTYNTYRIWGKFGPFPAVAERPGVDLAACEYGMTILHDVLFLPPAIGREASNVLLDISGSQVMSLHPGRNDVGHLPSGVYFVNGTGTSSVRKVVLAH
jgi:hypothetical protein